MSGTELENVLTSIDENIDNTRSRVWSEVMSYLNSHTSEVVEQLRAHQFVSVPTSFGNRRISLEQLNRLAAAS